MFVLVLDDLHTDPLRTPLVRRAARQFIQRHLGANDLAAVVFTSGRASAAQDFTGSKRLLLAAVDRFMGQKLRSRTLNRLDEYNRQRAIGFQHADARRPSSIRRTSSAPTRRAWRWTRSARWPPTWRACAGAARRCCSSARASTTTSPTSSRTARPTTVLDSRATRLARRPRSNVAFYTIDPRGLTIMGDEAMRDDRAARGPLRSGSAVDSLLRRAAPLAGQPAHARRGDRRVRLGERQRLRRRFDRVVRDNSTYYVLGYYPQNQRRDGRFREIEVRVNRPGLEVRARKGYVAPKRQGRARAPQRQAPPRTHRPCCATRSTARCPRRACPWACRRRRSRAAAPNASVAVVTQFGGRATDVHEKDGEFRNTIELSMIAVDAGGKIREGDRNTVDLKLSPQTHQAVLAARLPPALPPRPEARPLPAARRGARERRARRLAALRPRGARSSRRTALDERSGAHLRCPAATTPTARPDEQLKDVLPGPADRSCATSSSADTLSLFTEIYDNEPAKPHRVDISTLLLGEDGRTVFKTEDERSSDELKGATRRLRLHRAGAAEGHRAWRLRAACGGPVAAASGQARDAGDRDPRATRCARRRRGRGARAPGQGDRAGGARAR